MRSPPAKSARDPSPSHQKTVERRRRRSSPLSLSSREPRSDQRSSECTHRLLTRKQFYYFPLPPHAGIRFLFHRKRLDTSVRNNNMVTGNVCKNLIFHVAGRRPNVRRIARLLFGPTNKIHNIVRYRFGSGSSVYPLTGTIHT